MKVHPSIAAAAASGELERASCCLGNFDGVHLGHQALFAEAVRRGRPAALTFSPHPGKVLQPDLAPKLISTQARKLELMESCGLAQVVVQPFDPRLRPHPPGAFEAALFDQLKVSSVVVGHDFTYGAKRGGNLSSLEAAASARGAEVVVMAPVAVDGVVVSSSKVREYMLEGRVEAAKRLLGRFFDLDGTVVPGAGRGRTIGFPTANVDTANELRPAPGVYAVRVCRSAEPNRWYGGAANIGVKPTFGGTRGDDRGAPVRLLGRPLRAAAAGGVRRAAAGRAALRLGFGAVGPDRPRRRARAGGGRPRLSAVAAQ